MIAGQSGWVSRSSSRRFVMKIEALEVCAGMLNTWSLLSRAFSASTHGKEARLQSRSLDGRVKTWSTHPRLGTSR